VPIKIKLRGSVWYAIGSVARNRVRQSLGTASQVQAEELAAALEARLWKRHTYGEAAVRSFDEAVLSYLEADGEARFIDPVRRSFRGRTLESIKPGELRQAAQRLYPGCSPATWNRQVLSPARAIINHAASLGWCHPIVVEAFPVTRPRRRVVDRAWIDAFMAAADARGMPHLSAAVLFMHQTAARASETARLRWEHIDLSRRIAVLEQTKEAAWEERALTDELVVRLANLERVEGRPVFGYADRWGIRKGIQRVCVRAGLDYVPPHQAGRHSAATHALAAGFSVREVMDAYGWKTARMLLDVYAHTENAGRAIADQLENSGLKSGSHKRKLRK
jgi:integrase